MNLTGIATRSIMSALQRSLRAQQRDMMESQQEVQTGQKADASRFLGELASKRISLVRDAERLGAIPRGTHHWADFVTPDELRDLLAEAGLAMGAPRGIAWSPMQGLHLSDSMALNFIVTASR